MIYNYMLLVLFVINILTIGIKCHTQIAQSATQNALWKSWSNAIPASLATLLIDDANILSDYESTLPILRDNKRRTRWFPINTEPRIASELAIEYLLDLAVTNSIDKSRIVGCEYWFQRVQKSSSIGFHVDKDESVASNKHYLSHPLWSSIYYLTNNGGGTLITNQYSPAGNGYTPESPELGAWSFPEYNKFTIFNGTLLHGVISADPRVTDSDEPLVRLTFLINFWLVTPEPPNCDLLIHEQVPKLKLYSSNQMKQLRNKINKELSDSDNDKSIKPKRVKLTNIDVTPNVNDNMHNYRMSLPGNQHQYVKLPILTGTKTPIGETFQLIWSERQKKKIMKKEKKAKDNEDNSNNSSNKQQQSNSNNNNSDIDSIEINDIDSVPITIKSTKRKDINSAKEALKQKLEKAAKSNVKDEL